MKHRLRRLIREGRAPLALIAVILAVQVVLFACKPPETKMTSPSDSTRIAKLIESHSARLMAIPGVHGVAEGRTADGRPCILLLVENPDAPGLPTELEGVPVVFQRTDSLKAF